MASQTTGTGPGKKPWYGGEPWYGGGQRTAQPHPQHQQQQHQQQQHQQRQYQQQQYHQRFLKDLRSLLDGQSIQIAQVTVGSMTQCLQKAINDDGFMRDFGARIAGPKRKGGLLDKQGRTTHTTPDLDSLEKLKAVEEMIERQSGQAKSMLKAMENVGVQVALLCQKMDGMEAVMTGLAESLAAKVNDGRKGKGKTPATRRSNRIAKRQSKKGINQVA